MTKKYVFLADAKLYALVSGFVGREETNGKFTVKDTINNTLRVARLLGSIATLGDSEESAAELTDKVEISAGYDCSALFSLSIERGSLNVNEVTKYLSRRNVVLVYLDISLGVFVGNFDPSFLENVEEYSGSGGLEDFLIANTTRDFRCATHIPWSGDEILDVRFMDVDDSL